LKARWSYDNVGQCDVPVDNANETTAEFHDDNLGNGLMKACYCL
jgi:hypothetical protein